MNYIDLPPLLAAQGTVRLPGSKSISNRVLLLAALAVGDTEIRDLLESDDTARMLEALAALGVDVEALGDGAFRVRGAGGAFPVKDADLFLGNAGSMVLGFAISRKLPPRKVLATSENRWSIKTKTPATANRISIPSDGFQMSRSSRYQCLR